MPIQNGNPLTIADVVALHQTARTLVNNVRNPAIKPETFGPQHCPSILGVWDAYEWQGVEDITTISNPVVDPEPLPEILVTWAVSPSMVLNNGGAGYTIQRPCILFQYCTVTVKGDAGIPPTDLNNVSHTNRWLGFNLQQKINGLTTDNGEERSRWIRPFQVGSAGGGADVTPPTCWGQTVTIVVATEYDDTSPTLTLDELQLRYVLFEKPPWANNGDARLIGGSIGFFALHTAP